MTDADDWVACQAQACHRRTLDFAAACSFGKPWPAGDPWVRWEAYCNPPACAGFEASQSDRPGEGGAGLQVLRANRPGRHPRRSHCQQKVQERLDRPMLRQIY